MLQVLLLYERSDIILTVILHRNQISISEGGEMNPIAFELGPLSVRWYGLLFGIAFLIGIFGITRQAKKAGLNEDDIFSTLLYAIPISILGARLYYVLFEWSYYSKHLNEVLAVWKGGLAVHGGLFAGILTLYLCSKYYKFSFIKLLDIASVYMLLGQGIGRWGNYFNQEAYGYEVSKADWPLAMYIDGAYRHPTFLYESVWNFVGVFLLLFYQKKNPPKGQMAFFYLMYYSLGRFFIEGFRTDSLMIFGLRTAQLISLLLFVLGFVLWCYNRCKMR